MLRLRKNKLSTPFSKDFPEISGLKILHLSDFHMRKVGRREKKILKIIEENSPDLILMTGDYLDYVPKVDLAVNFLKRLKAPMGVFGNVGNVDYLYPKNVARIKKELPQIILINKIKRLTFNGVSLWVAGLDDPILYKDYSIYKKKTSKIINSLPKNEPHVVLIHRPEQIPLVLSLGAKFILCGHTHGGQMRLPFGLQFYNQSKECKKYFKGIFNLENSVIHVSGGIGTSDIPMRFLSPPEVSLLEL